MKTCPYIFAAALFLFSIQIFGQTGNLDLTFNEFDQSGCEGISTVNVYDTKVLPSGKKIIAGDFISYNETAVGSIIRLNQDGLLDPTFNSSAFINSDIRKIAVQPDGKVLASGFFGAYGTYKVIRINDDGTIDNTFSSGAGFNGFPSTLLLQSDGKIVLGGYFTYYNYINKNRIVRLNSDGSIDQNFSIGTGTNGTPTSMSLQSDGKIVISVDGYATYNGTLTKGIFRINTNGTIDNTFQFGTGPNNVILSSCIQPDGKILIAGNFTTYNGVSRNRMCRLNVDGTLDGTFTSNGLFTVTNLSNQPYIAINCIYLRDDGKVLVGGYFDFINGVSRKNIALFSSTGVLESASFNNGGFNYTVFNITRDIDNDVLISGHFTQYAELNVNYLAKVNASGILNTTFNVNRGANGAVRTAVIDSLGKIFIGGDFTHYNGVQSKRIIKLNSNGSVDLSFNVGLGANGTVNAIALQSDGKLIVGGIFSTWDGSMMNSIVRLNPNGTIDNTFVGSSSFANSSYGGVKDIEIEQNGKIIVVGGFSVAGGSAGNGIMRLNPDGTLDNTFNVGIGTNGGNLSCIEKRSSGNYIVGGIFNSINGISRIGLAEINPDGTINSNNFTSAFSQNVGVTDVEELENGKVIVSATLGLFGFNSDGSVNSVFNTYSSDIRTILELPDSKIMVGGYFTSLGVTAVNQLARLYPDGSIDVSFNSGIGLSLSSPYFNPGILCLANVGNNQLLVGGDFDKYNGNFKHRLARINNNSCGNEICNGIDDDCDGSVDDGLTFVNYYNDLDGDGYGSGTAMNACSQPANTVTNNTDCNDNNAAINSISSEICNSFDDDCDGSVDDGLTFVNYYNDQDADGYGSGTATNACSQPANTVTNNTDCNDNNASLNSISAEICNNFDDDCDGSVDDGLTFVNYYNDQDGDGYGAGSATNACSQPANTVTNNTDCNDNNASLNSISSEICNSFDDDCDGSVDDGLTFVNYYNDQDADGYGSVTATNACSQPANTVTNNTDCNDNNANVRPGVLELCTNSIDDNCNGQVNENCTSGGTGDEPTTAVNVININQYGTGTQNTNTINLATATSTTSGGNDVWFLFTAQNNAIRVSLKGSLSVADDNKIKLYNYTTTPSSIMIPIDTEDDVHPGSQGLASDGGDEVLYYDQLFQGQQYWICIQNSNATPGICTLTISYLKGSQPDIGAYTNYTGVYSNTCANFKAAFRPNAFQYTVNRHVSNDLYSMVDWSYTIPNSGTTTSSLCQLGRILPVNLSGSLISYYVSVDVYYSMKDAFGNTEAVYADGNVISTVGLNSESDLFVRTTDQCPVFKSTTSSLSTNRSICGTEQYNWNFTMVSPTVGLPINVNGPMGGSRTMAMSSITGIANGQRYDVKIRSQHVDGATYSSYGTVKCVKTLGAAGMVLEAEVDIVVTNTEGLLLYPNPNNGRALTINITGMDGNIMISLLDATGRLLQSTTGYSEGNLIKELEFTQTLISGLYEIRVSNGKEQRVARMMVGR